ncbi:nickel transport system ATP-binding protein [Paenibacillus cellulosilyticus]|uniref:Nickel transport system ATP-binding protein n=1 Tax=Paenibacillus cellulosilyticus TaxID=375489 RepID=A0A2V2YQH9_9BACL|nr:ABC transporter ATP-binding protein [Paenibacillus cellulosilyticus]PWV99351.1 nickel transport system ATP-binding protein [Paenibacillus cellulosilyticus]QKS45114.1 ABC transporter ATP-binding protein [Paenibacillus cellulosilyticus]
MLKVDRISKSYRPKGWLNKAHRKQVLHAISFEWDRGECLGIIGESGSGKSTLGRLLLGIEKPDHGIIAWDGQPITDRNVRQGNISAVFQDYTSSINPFYTVRQAIMEPLKLAGGSPPSFMESYAGKLLQQVGMDESYLDKYPHKLSGGEAQRVCIARALSTGPACIVLDEAISSLDGSVQMQVLELLRNLSDSLGVGYIFITHDIAAAAYLCNRMMIIQDGRIVEMVETKQLKDVQSPYAKELLRKVMA